MVWNDLGKCLFRKAWVTQSNYSEKCLSFGEENESIQVWVWHIFFLKYDWFECGLVYASVLDTARHCASKKRLT